MKKLTFLTLALLMAVATAAGSPVISASVDNLDFGEVEVGYPVTKTLTVGGQDLVGNIDLAIQARSVKYYKVTPETITPAEAANGVTVKVTYGPGSDYWSNAELVLSSENADDVVIPLTASPYYPDNELYNNQTVSFTSHVGQLVSQVGIVRFADVEVPHDPTPPVVDRSGAAETALSVYPGHDGMSDYSCTIEGSPNFSVMITKASALAKICTVRINYWPQHMPVNGVEHATLKLTCVRAGVPIVTIPLEGTATLLTCDPLALPMEAGQTTATSFDATWKMNCYEQGVQDFLLECAPAGTEFEVWNPDYQVFTYLTPDECPFTGHKLHIGLNHKTYSYTIGGLQSDVIYSFRVKARFVDGSWSEWSNVQNVVLGDNTDSGDADGDGVITVNDVSVLIDRLLGN